MPLSDRRSLERREGSRRNSDRRRPRLAVPGLAVRVLVASNEGQSLLSGRLIDISLTGIQLSVDTNVELNATVLVEVRLEETCLNLSARVARTRLEDGVHVIGCRLVSPPPPDKLAILRQLTKAVATA